MVRLSFVLPYYKNPTMLAEQYRVWSSYAQEQKDCIEIVVVDDGSPQPAVGVPRPDGLPSLRIYRVLEDRPWHQHGARNLGAREASGEWLFLTDMDHVLPSSSLDRLLPRLGWTMTGEIGGVPCTGYVGGDPVYTFHRLDAPSLQPKRNDRGELHPHPNTFAMRKSRYWQIGGYDERLCGFYGTDGYFRKRLGATTHLGDVPVIRYPREVIADASTTEPGIDPRELRNAGRRTQERNAVLASIVPGEPIPVVQFPWERVL